MTRTVTRTVTRTAVLLGLAGLLLGGGGGGAAVPAAPVAPAAPATPVAPAASAAPATPAGGPAAGEADGEALTRAWRASGDTADLRTVERAGATLFPYGHGRAVLRCAPLRACAVELEPAETLLATASGDGERWIVQPAVAGPGGRTPLLIVKPTACDLSTNLVVATDRRIYELALESPPCRDADAGLGSLNPRLPYTGLARFYYPDELVRRWAQVERLAAARADGAAREAAAESGAVELAPGVRLADLNFDYTWRRERRFPWAPSQVFDDGKHTYIVLPEGARHAEAPVLFALQPDGTPALLNYRLERQTYVADRVLERAVLMAGADGGRGRGAGRRDDRLEIVNHSPHRARPARREEGER